MAGAGGGAGGVQSCFLEEIKMKYFGGSWLNRLGHSRLGLRQSRSQEMACGSITKAAELSVLRMGTPPFWAKSEFRLPQTPGGQ